MHHITPNYMAKLPPPSDPKISRYILQHSDLIISDEILGHGASGTVYVGQYSKTGVKVAIKEIIDDSSDRATEFYIREVENLASLNHTFLLPFVGYTLSPPYSIVTKFIEGGSLYSALRDDPHHLNLTPTDLSFIAYGIADAMTYLHSKEVIHRDLKTQNILLDKNKSPVIADFGSSKNMGLGDPKTGLMGTPNYMAPEFLRTDPYNQAVDVYSYGVVLWEMITRETPFGQLEPIQMVFCVGMGKETLIIPDEIPEPLSDLIRSCLSLKPEQRPTFSQILEKLSTFLIVYPGTDVNLLSSMINKSKQQRTNHINVKPKSSFTQSANISELKYNPDSFFNSTVTSQANESRHGKKSPKRHRVKIDQQLEQTKRNHQNEDFVQSIPRPQVLPQINVRSNSVQPMTESFNIDIQLKLKGINQVTQEMALNLQMGKNEEFAFQYFESHLNEPNLVTPNLWEDLLALSQTLASNIAKNRMIEKSQTTSKRLTKLLVNFAQHQENLNSLECVPNYESYINNGNLDFYLYVISFLPSVIGKAYILCENIMTIILSAKKIDGKDPLNFSGDFDLFSFIDNSSLSTIDSLFNSDLKKTSSESKIYQKGIILLIKIFQLCQSPDIQMKILSFFQKYAIEFVNYEGGDLMIKLLQSRNILSSDLLSKYGMSKIIHNVIAAYECFYSSERTSDIFPLSVVLHHFSSNDPKLRNNAIEFIRRIIFTVHGEQLEQIIDTLLITVLRFSSEKAMLLLCQIASTNSQLLMRKKYTDIWLQVSAHKAHLFISLFAVVFKHLGNELINNHDTPIFLGSALKSNDYNAFLSVCWILGQIEINNNFAISLYNNEVVDLIVKRLCSSKNSETIIYSNLALSKIITLLYSPKFVDAAKYLTELIKENHETIGNCISTLSCLTIQPKLIEHFSEDNILELLAHYKNNHEYSIYIERIEHNFKHLKSV